MEKRNVSWRERSIHGLYSRSAGLVQFKFIEEIYVLEASLLARSPARMISR